MPPTNNLYLSIFLICFSARMDGLPFFLCPAMPAGPAHHYTTGILTAQKLSKSCVNVNVCDQLVLFISFIVILAHTRKR
jgi:hypothetical protein